MIYVVRNGEVVITDTYFVSDVGFVDTKVNMEAAADYKKQELTRLAYAEAAHIIRVYSRYQHPNGDVYVRRYHCSACE
jgi:hypothetical protein